MQRRIFQNFPVLSSFLLHSSHMPLPRQPWSFASRAVNGRAECPSCSSSVSSSHHYYRHLKNCSLFQKERGENLWNQPPTFSPSQPARQPIFSQPLGIVPLQPMQPPLWSSSSPSPACQASPAVADVRRACRPHFPPANRPPPAHSKTFLPGWLSDPD